MGKEKWLEVYGMARFLKLNRKIAEKAEKSSFPVWYAYYRIRRFLKYEIHSDEYLVNKMYRNDFGRDCDLKNPKRFSEKVQWLKLYERKDFHTVLADKYASRDYISKNFGDEYLVPLMFVTDDWREIKPENIPDEPCIIKPNNNCGKYHIVRNKDEMDWYQVRMDARKWMAENMYYRCQEWQYKNMKPCLLVEKLLLDKEGRIPNDYKLHFFDGELEFVYCSIDREGRNYRNIYDKDWKPLNFQLIAPQKYNPDIRGPEIPAPETFDKMKEMGRVVAKLFKYVRVDFYDVNGRLYFGEITLHHGSGTDHFYPDEYDFIYGDKIKLDLPDQGGY